MNLELGFAFRSLTFQLKFCCSCALFHVYDGETQEGHDVQCYKEICSVNIKST
jgi:hypothetical protein